MKIKNIIISLAALFYLALLSSCSSSTKITINAKPGTVFPALYDKENKMVKCDQTGAVTYKHSDDNYIGLTYSFDKDRKIIPFAFDYGKRGNAAIVFGNIGKAIAVTGVFIDAIGAIIICAGGEDVGITVALAGLGTVGFGFSFWGPLDAIGNQKAYEYHYKYKRHQNTNQDLAFTQPTITLLDPPQVYQNEISTTYESSPAPEEKNNNSDAAVSSKTLGERSTKKLSNNADKVSGTYVGTGILKHDGVAMESYSNISVTIEKVSNNIVGVNVVEENGDRFFAHDLEYDIINNRDGSYTLVSKKTKDAKISIVLNSMDYIHPKVNIEGDIYQLHINASKQ